MIDPTKRPKCNCNHEWEEGKKRTMAVKGMYYICSRSVANGGCGKLLLRNAWDREQEQINKHLK